MHLYYLDDHSLGEIAEEYEISRQAVYDNIRRTDAMLEEYEDKLRVLEKLQQRQVVMEQLQQVIQTEPVNRKRALELVEQLKESD